MLIVERNRECGEQKRTRRAKITPMSDRPVRLRSERSPTLISRHAEAVLSAHCHQGASNDCAPFAAAMVLNGIFGADVDPVDLARRLDHPRRRAFGKVLPLIRRIPRSATFPWGVVDALRGYESRSDVALDAGWRLCVGPDVLLAGLVSGHLLLPYIGGFRPRPWGHVVVLIGWDAKLGWGVADPQRSTPEIFWIPDELFRKRRRAMAGLVVIAHLR